jgi:hypothetical protein
MKVMSFNERQREKPLYILCSAIHIYICVCVYVCVCLYEFKKVYRVEMVFYLEIL